MSRWFPLAVLCLAALSADAIAQPADAPPPRPSLTGSSGNAGVGFYQPGRWGLIQNQLANPTQNPADLRIIFRFTDQPQRQFIRDVAVPPMSRVAAILPVRFGAMPDDRRSAETESILTPTDSEQEISRQAGLVRLMDDVPSTFVIISDQSPGSDRSVAALAAVRERVSLPRSMGYIPEGETMRYDVGWDGVDLAAVTAADPALDAAQAQSLRRWLRAGGTLVLFAHQNDHAAIARLLPEIWTIEPVDTVTLTTVPFAPGPAHRNHQDLTANSEPLGTVQTETPILMQRLIATGFDTHVQVAGWPALLTRPFGQGKIVVVAIDEPAWTDPAAAGAMAVLSDQLVKVTVGRAVRTPAQVIIEQVGASFVADKIGYRIVPRATLAIVLGAFAAVLVIAAAVWARSRRLEWLGVTGVIAACAAGGALLAIGQGQRQQIPPSSASIQLIGAEPGDTEGRLTAMVGLYNATGGQVDVTGTTGGYAWPAEFRTVGALSRLRSDDLDKWTWLDVPLAAGAIRPIEIAGPVPLEKPLDLVMRFTPTGLAGEIHWPRPVNAQDLLLAAGGANLRINTEHSGDTTKLAIDAAADVLPPGVLHGGAVLGQDQQDRARVLGPILAEQAFDRPTVLAWTEGMDAGIELSPDLARRAEALWTIPLRMAPAKAGDVVRVPWPLVKMSPLRDRASKLDLTILPIYQPHLNRWIESVSNASAFLARFQLPEQVLPLTPGSARIYIDMTATGRTVTLLSYRAGKLVEVGKLASPSGSSIVEVPGELLEIDSDGGIVLAFDVSKTADQLRAETDPSAAVETRGTDMWSIRHFGLEVAGTVGQEDSQGGVAARLSR